MASIKHLSQNYINKLSYPEGILLEIIPSETSLNSISDMQTVLHMIGQYSGRFAFEIWKDDKFSFHFYSSSSGCEGLLRGQLSSVYPQCEIRKSNSSFTLMKAGDYISSCNLVLNYSDFSLKQANDFHYDPLRHLITAMNIHDCRFLIQVLFKRKKKIPKKTLVLMYQKNVKFVFQCIIRIVTISPNRDITIECCEHLSHIFSVFDSDGNGLSPKFPIIVNLNPIVKRNFPLIGKKFLICSSELASFVHLPVGLGNIIDYVNPSLSW